MALIDMFGTVFGGEMSHAYINELPAAALARYIESNCRLLV